MATDLQGLVALNLTLLLLEETQAFPSAPIMLPPLLSPAYVSPGEAKIPH